MGGFSLTNLGVKIDTFSDYESEVFIARPPALTSFIPPTVSIVEFGDIELRLSL